MAKQYTLDTLPWIMNNIRIQMKYEIGEASQALATLANDLQPHRFAYCCDDEYEDGLDRQISSINEMIKLIQTRLNIANEHIDKAHKMIKDPRIFDENDITTFGNSRALEKYFKDINMLNPGWISYYTSELSYHQKALEACESYRKQIQENRAD